MKKEFILKDVFNACDLTFEFENQKLKIYFRGFSDVNFLFSVKDENLYEALLLHHKKEKDLGLKTEKNLCLFDNLIFELRSGFNVFIYTKQSLRPVYHRRVKVYDSSIHDKELINILSYKK